MNMSSLLPSSFVTSANCQLWKRRAHMEPREVQAKATIAATLITTHAVDIPAIPKGSHAAQDQAATRLRELTDYVYQAIIDSQA